MKKQKHEVTTLELFGEETEKQLNAFHEEEVKNALHKNEIRRNYKPKKTKLSQILESEVISSQILQEKLNFSKAKADKIIDDLNRMSFLLWNKDHYIITSPEGVKGYFYNSADDEYELVNQIQDLTDKLRGIAYYKKSDKLSKNVFEKLLSLKFEIDDDFLPPSYYIPLSEEEKRKIELENQLIYKFLEVSDTELANVLPYEQAMQLSEFDKNLQDKLKQKYENAEKQHQTAFEQICNNINQGHITITTIQRCYGFDYGKASQIMNELIKKGLVKKVDANYEIFSKEGLIDYFRKLDN